jgi:bifunctional non-homologous end joining protein LigD
MGLEGIVSKRADKPYLSQRTKSWLKSKCTGNDEFVIGGYRRSNKKGRAFASLLLGEYVGNELHYRGRVGTGFDAELLHDLGERLSRLQRPTSPFVDAPRASWHRSHIRRRRRTDGCATRPTWGCAATSPPRTCNRNRS